MDGDGIIENMCRPAQSGEIQFKDIARFQMITTANIPIVVALQENALELVRALEFTEHKGGILRKLASGVLFVTDYQTMQGGTGGQFRQLRYRHCARL